ncbi:MAG: hypothetical protein SNG34_06305 [Rikenellaceae bacterium]
MILGSKIDIENVFTIANDDEIIEFCKQYALQNSEFAESLIERFIKLDGDSIEDRIASIDIEIASCFKFKVKDAYKRKWGPYLDWEKISSGVWGLTHKGKVMIEQGHVKESAYLAIEIIRKISELYVKDEVWNETELDGDSLGSDFALDLLSMAINTNALNLNDIEGIIANLKEIKEMEANTEYGIIWFNRIDNDITTAHQNLQNKSR